MRYKAEYSPAYLADPVCAKFGLSESRLPRLTLFMQETYIWYHLEECIPLLDKYRYACFTDPSRSIEGDAPEAEEGL